MKYFNSPKNKSLVFVKEILLWQWGIMLKYDIEDENILATKLLALHASLFDNSTR